MTSSFPPRKLGSRWVNPIGFGPMRMSLDERVADADAIRVIHAALDSGATFIDTADVYARGPGDEGRNERLIAAALKQWPGGYQDVVVGTKAGHGLGTAQGWYHNGRPENITAACERSLAILGTDTIDLYQLHGVDPAVPYEDLIGAFADLQASGKIRMVGLCNAGRSQIAKAREIVEIVSVQSRFSPQYRQTEKVLDYCRDEGLAFLSWSPLGNVWGQAAPNEAGLLQVAASRGVSTARIALAWALTLAPHIIPLLGATREETARDALAATAIVLDDQEMKIIADSFERKTA